MEEKSAFQCQELMQIYQLLLDLTQIFPVFDFRVSMSKLNYYHIDFQLHVQEHQQSLLQRLMLLMIFLLYCQYYQVNPQLNAALGSDDILLEF